MSQLVQPAEICKALLAALEAAEGRRRKRKRDQTPDAIGLAVKRDLLECVVRDNPGPEAFEQWLLDYCQERAYTIAFGSVRAMALSVFEEWRMARSMDSFKGWLERGAPSDDADPLAAAPRR
jgi:hypothetical protein